MKISSIKGHKHYNPEFPFYDVYLDSVHQESAVYANDKKGIIKNRGNDWKFRGKVTIINKSNVKNIIPIPIASSGYLFACEGEVINVYETNAFGEKVLVDFYVGMNNTFKLKYNPYGNITCDIAM